ncbi:unnamed protein product [Effrenium voratum]|nr:unnamed protein product [Effrenium voratum]
MGDDDLVHQQDMVSRGWRLGDKRSLVDLVGLQGMVFSVELLDREGGEIRASLFNEAAEQHYDLMQCGRCFTLCNGSVRPAQKKYSVLKHGHELVFDGRCQIHMVDDDADIGAVRLAVQKIASVTQMPVPSSVDICGVIVSAEHPQEFQTKEGKALVKREITVANDSGHSVLVTLWGDRARLDSREFAGSPVVALKGVQVKEWMSCRSGSMAEAGSMILNPNFLPEAAWWYKGGNQQRLTYISHSSSPAGSLRPSQRATSVEISAMSQQAVRAMPLYYMACLELKDGGSLQCNRRVDETGCCRMCQKSGKVGPRLNVRCRFQDAFGSCWVTVFHPAAEKVLGSTAESIVELSQQSEEICEEALKDTYYDEMLELQLRAKPDTWGGEARTNVTCVGAQRISSREHSRMLLKEIHQLLK